MADTIFPGGFPKDVDQVAVQQYPLASNDPILIPIPTNVELNDDAVEDTLEGAGATHDTARIPVSLDWSFEVGGMPLTARGIILGETVTETGVRPNRIRRMPIHNNKTFPYFRLLARAADNQGGDTLYTLPYCVLQSLSDDRTYGSFGRLPLSGKAVAREGSDSAADVQLREVAQAIAGTIPAEYGNRPFGLRAVAVARTWYANHVWDKYTWDPPAQISVTSNAAYTESTEIFVNLNHYDIQRAGLVVSKAQALTSPLLTSTYTVETEVSTSTPAATLGSEVGIQLPTTNIVPSTLQVTLAGRSSTGDYTQEESISISPDTSGQWVYNTTNGRLTKSGLAATTTVYYRYDLPLTRLKFASGVTDAEDIYFRYTPSQEINLRLIGALSNVHVYKGITESYAVGANEIASAAIRIQRGLNDGTHGGKLWLRTGDHIAPPALAADDNLIITGTGYARKSAAIVHPNTCNYSLETTEYSANSRDRLSEFSARTNMLSLNLEGYAYDLDVIEITTGVRATTSGQDNARVAKLDFEMGKPSPFFTLVRQSTSSESTDAARDIFPRVKITSYGRTQNQGEFNMFNVGLNGIGQDEVGDDQNIFIWTEQYETTQDIDLETI